MSLVTEILMKNLERDIGRVKPFSDVSTLKHVAAYQLQRSLVKKYTDGSTSAMRQKAAIDKFHIVNAQCAKYIAPSPLASRSTLTGRIFERARTLFEQQFSDRDGLYRFSLNHAFNLGGVGPGASVNAEGKDIMAKLFMSRLSCTHKHLFTLYRATTRNSFRWEVAELVRASQHGKFKVVRGSNLFTVPKDNDIDRVAFTEPTLNMWGQLGYGKLIEKVLVDAHGITISEQEPINSWFACAGSQNGNFGTIDLSSASDTISLTLCEALLPKRLMSDLKFLRSKYAKVPGCAKDTVLHMISTMGNGFTFPLETLIFSNLVLATYIECGEPVFDNYGKRRYCVYGDDIICATSVYDQVIDVLSISGFTVNKTKSYGSGAFRESCGTDFFKGHDVRGIYLKSSKSDAHVYSLINRLLQWVAKHKLPLPNTISYLLTLVPYRPVPFHESVTAGIFTPIDRLTCRKTSPCGHWYYHGLEAIAQKEAIDDEVGNLYFHGAVISAVYGGIRGQARMVRRETDAPLKEDDIQAWKVVKKFSPLHWEQLNHIPRTTIYEFDAGFTSQDLAWAYEASVARRVT